MRLIDRPEVFFQRRHWTEPPSGGDMQLTDRPEVFVSPSCAGTAAVGWKRVSVLTMAT